MCSSDLEHKGGVSGKDIIKAIAIGQDVFLRIRRSLLGQRLDWLATTVIGVFSATAAAASVLGLDADQTANALGIASLVSCGTLEMRFGTGSDLGEIYAGFVAKSALLSTLLAQKGVTGTQSVFEGQAGIMNVYFGGQYDRARILAQLGSHFEGATMQYKPWPVCGIANTYIHAILEIMRGHDLTVGQIAEIRPYVGDFQQRMSYPLDQRRQPACSMDARFSMPFCLAVAAVHHEVGVAHFTTEALSDPAVLAAAKLVVPIDDAAYDWKTQMPDARIDVVLNDGRILTGTGAGTPGTAEHPMGWPELVEKFQNCAAFSAVPVSPEQVADVIEQMKRLDELVDGTAPIRALSPAS